MTRRRRRVLGASGASIPSGAVLWLDAADASTITESSGSVSQWDDKSGNGNNVTQSTGSEQPTTGVSTSNGLNVLSFDGGDTLNLPSGLFDLGEDNSTIFAVVQCADNTSQMMFFNLVETFTSRYTLWGEFSSQINFDHNAGSAAKGSVDRINTNVYTASRTGTAIVVGSNGVDGTVSNTATDATNITSGTIGSYRGISAHLTGFIAEIIVYDRSLTAVEKDNVNNYLSSKWRGFKQPSDITGLQAWYDTSDDTYLTLDGDAITQVLDRSGNGNDTDVQGTASSRPTRVTDHVNGLQAAVFDGGDHLNLPSDLYSLANGDNTCIVVAKRDTEDGSDEAMFGFSEDVAGTFSGRLLLRYNTTATQIGYVSANSFNILSQSGNVNTDYQVIQGKREGTARSLSVNNTVIGTDSNGSDENNVGNGRLGSLNPSFPQGLDGTIAEVLLYNRALTSAEEKSVTDYLINKWTPIQLPTDIQGLGAWYDTTSDDYLTLDGDAITQFLDRSDNGNDSNVQGTAANRPTRTENYINGLQTAVFDGVNDAIEVPDDSSIADIFDGGGTIFAVASPVTDGENSFGRIVRKGWAALLLDDNGTASNNALSVPFSGDDGFWILNGKFTPLNEATIVQVEYDDSSTANNPVISINGESKTIIESTAPTGTADSNVGTSLYIGNRAAGDRTFDGGIAELIIFDRVLTTKEQDAMNNYLSNKYNIGLS